MIEKWGISAVITLYEWLTKCKTISFIKNSSDKQPRLPSELRRHPESKHLTIQLSRPLCCFHPLVPSLSTSMSSSYFLQSTAILEVHPSIWQSRSKKPNVSSSTPLTPFTLLTAIVWWVLHICHRQFSHLEEPSCSFMTVGVGLDFWPSNICVSYNLW